jgi:hypothetical protein
MKSCADNKGVRVSATWQMAFREIFSRTSGNKSKVYNKDPISSIDVATNPVSASRTIAISGGLFSTNGVNPKDIASTNAFSAVP